MFILFTVLSLSLSLALFLALSLSLALSLARARALSLALSSFQSNLPVFYPSGVDSLTLGKHLMGV